MAKSYAEKLNEHLAAGGTVVIGTYTKAWQYSKKHAGMFFMDGENLQVKRGHSSDCLSIGKRLLVSVKLYR